MYVLQLGVRNFIVHHNFINKACEWILLKQIIEKTHGFVKLLCFLHIPCILKNSNLDAEQENVFIYFFTNSTFEKYFKYEDVFKKAISLRRAKM